MNYLLPRARWGVGAIAGALMTLTTVFAEDDGSRRAVYVMTNEASGNRVMVFERASNGMLTPGQTVATGGLGSGQFEDSANGLILASLNSDVSPNNLASNGKFLIATNAASNSISVFRVGKNGEDNGDDNDDDEDEETDRRGTGRDSSRNGLTLVDVEPSNGEHPVSVTVSDGVVYVLNNGDACRSF